MLATSIAMTVTKANILIVDDQIDNLRVLSVMLSQRGYKVRKAVSGEVALETARLDPPNLILLDINMPHMNGYEVCSVLKQTVETRDIPVIFLSALSDAIDKVKAFTVGGVDYITKPFQAEEIFIRVQHQLKLQQQQQQLQREVKERRYAEELLKLQLKREKLLATVTNYIRETVQLDEVLEKTVVKIRELLNVDRVLIGRISSNNNLEIVAESTQSPEFSLLGQTFQSPDIKENWHDLAQDKSISMIENVCNMDAFKDGADVLSLPQVKASVMLPIQQSGQLWGVIMTHTCTSPRTWQTWETELLHHLTVQLEIAIRQADLYRSAQVQINDLHKLNQIRDDLLNTTFHELRAPIANIKLISRLLMVSNHQTSRIEGELPKPEAQDNKDNKVTHYLKILQDECERELQLIQDLLDLHHLEAGTQSSELAPVDLKYWIPHITEPFEMRMQNQQQTLRLQLDPDLPLINTDYFCLSRILTELVNNACKYTPANETITIIAYTEDKILHLSVINTGVNISAKECALIFNRFYRIHNYDFWKSGGTGLGLTLVQRLVDYLNGSIQVTSANQKTCFTVKLPIETI